MERYYDTHTHYDYKKFSDGSRGEILRISRLSGIEWMLNPAISYESNFTMRELLGQYPWIDFAAGIHPNYAGRYETMTDHREKERCLWELLEDRRTAAIGETGLDYHYYQDELWIENQKYWFHKHIEMAQKSGLPLILHVRDAAKDALEILEGYGFKENSGVIHCFGGDAEEAKAYVDLGFLLGIGGRITHEGEEALVEAVKKTDLEKIVLETDCPLIKTAGCEGRKASSLDLPVIARKIADIKGLAVEEVAEVTFENAVQLFR